MRLVAYEKDGLPSWGVVTDQGTVEGPSIAANLPATLPALIAAGPAALANIRQALAAGLGTMVANVKPILPVGRNVTTVCVGLNYTKHAIEGGNPIPDYPALFMRGYNSLVAAEAPMLLPHVSEKLDYEAELMIVIGKRGRYISEADALDYVFGYTIFNDGSVRDFQRKSTQWTVGKNFDRTGAIGPWIVTADDLPLGATNLRILSRLDGEIMQDSDTGDMIFSTAKAVHYVSEFMTLEPGDVIAMGTPSGVGYARKPPVFMRHGQIVEIEIEGIGILRNPIVAEPSRRE